MRATQRSIFLPKAIQLQKGDFSMARLSVTGKFDGVFELFVGLLTDHNRVYVTTLPSVLTIRKDVSTQDIRVRLVSQDETLTEDSIIHTVEFRGALYYAGLKFDLSDFTFEDLNIRLGDCVTIDGDTYTPHATELATQLRAHTGFEITGSDIAETITGESYALAGHDTIQLLEGDDSAFGGLGNDLIEGGEGKDTLLGGEGRDTLIGGEHNDSIQGGNGNDKINGGLGNDALEGGSGQDRIVGDSNDDTIDGGAGNDRIYGGSENDLLDGGAGNDLLYGGAGDDSISGGNNSDRLFGQNGNDILKGGKGGDRLFGGKGTDELLGGHGKDTLKGGDGRDTLTGGLGSDEFHFGTGIKNDVITDFAVGIDKIVAVNASTFEDLTFQRTGVGVVVTDGDVSMLIKGVFFKHLDADDFLF